MNSSLLGYFEALKIPLMQFKTVFDLSATHNLLLVPWKCWRGFVASCHYEVEWGKPDEWGWFCMDKEAHMLNGFCEDEKIGLLALEDWH